MRPQNSFPGLSLLVAAAGLWIASPAFNQTQAASPNAAILQDLKGFCQMGTVLHIAAHPDDENTQLITYLSRGRNYRTGYLSLTRGDGGQNLLGPEFGEQLGVARTQELLAARRLDGGRQFFSRALDFGFSKDYRETLNVWDHQQVLSDIVRVIRTFRPDVLITRFSPQPSGTHGHHTASAYLALEAFKLCGDPHAFPEQLKTLSVWQPKRIFMNGGGGSQDGEVLHIDVSGTDPVTGESFGEIAGRSRSMHKTQGFGNFGGGRGGGPRIESFKLLAGEPASKDILDGIDTTWNRVAGGDEIGKMAEEAVAKFNSDAPAASVPALLALRSRLAALPSEPLVDDKRLQLDHILAECLGLSYETTIETVEAVPGEKLSLHHSVTLRSGVPVRWKEVRYPANASKLEVATDLEANKMISRDSTPTLPVETALTQPYWLREESTAGMFQVSDPSLIGRPENRPAFPVENVFEVGGQELVLADEPIEAGSSETKREMKRRLEVIPSVAIGFASKVELFGPGAQHPVVIEVSGARQNVSGNVELNVPDGWAVSPEKQAFNIAKIGDHLRLTFNVTAPTTPTVSTLSAHVEVGGKRFGRGRVEIKYAHLPLLLLQPAARARAVCLELANRGRKIGYLPGAGDNLAESLEQMGCTVTRLTGEDLTPERLKDLDAVVIGIRAFNTRTDIADRMPALFAFVENGGNVIVQYNRPEGIKVKEIAPYHLKLSQERVCEENAVVTLLKPDHPALNTPNKITLSDFEGWVQERGSYFPTEWDSQFVPLISCSDSGEAQKSGGLLVAHYGKGYFVYTGMTWFRQLPAGVPGAYRIFANLVSLGK